jgi:hypothetical protein
MYNRSVKFFILPQIPTSGRASDFEKSGGSLFEQIGKTQRIAEIDAEWITEVFVHLKIVLIEHVIHVHPE